MRSAVLVLFLAYNVAAVPALWPETASASGNCSMIFVKGLDADGTPDEVKALVHANATHSRAYLLWRYVEPELKTVNHSLTVDIIRADPSIIDAWAATVSWAELESRVVGLVQAGITIIGEVGEGTVTGLPKYQNGTADPHALGDDLYLAYLYMTARGTVRHFKDRVHIWQIENELNEAYLASLGGQRQFHLFGSRWTDFDFLTTILKTLGQAVKDEQPNAILTQNLHTDMSKKVHDEAHLPGFYLDAAKAWEDLVDVYSFDGYPNYFGAWPLYGNVIGERMAALRAVVPSKDVFVMETGYPQVADPSVAPEVAQYTEERQAAYVEQVWNSTMAAGGCGVMYFKLAAESGLPTPPGGYQEDDAKAIQLLADEIRSQNLLKMAEFIALHLKETPRFKYLVDYSQAWGMLHPDGTHRKAVDTLHTLWA